MVFLVRLGWSRVRSFDLIWIRKTFRSPIDRHAACDPAGPRSLVPRPGSESQPGRRPGPKARGDGQRGGNARRNSGENAPKDADRPGLRTRETVDARTDPTRHQRDHPRSQPRPAVGGPGADAWPGQACGKGKDARPRNRRADLLDDQDAPTTTGRPFPAQFSRNPALHP